MVVPILALALRRCQTNSRRWACDELPVYNLSISLLPLSSRGHPVCRLVVSPISSELSGCRGSAGAALSDLGMKGYITGGRHKELSPAGSAERTTNATSRFALKLR